MTSQTPVQNELGFLISVKKDGESLIIPIKKTICTKRVSKGQELNRELSTKLYEKSTKNQVMHEVIHIIHKKSEKNGAQNAKKTNMCFVKVDETHPDFAKFLTTEM